MQGSCHIQANPCQPSLARTAQQPSTARPTWPVDLIAFYNTLAHTKRPAVAGKSAGSGRGMKHPAGLQCNACKQCTSACAGTQQSCHRQEPQARSQEGS